ncbi:MAG: MFS transporter [Sandaracinaceae bacterium]
MTSDARTKMTPYHWRLFLFLGVASFFEGYDHIALSQILPNFRAEMGVSEVLGSRMVGVIMAGTVVAFLLVRYADRVGRRPVLTLTIAGYTICSFLSGLSPNWWVFMVLQFLARIFLIGEWAISMVYAAEEFPADRRGLMIGLVNAFAAFGSVACAGLVPILLDSAPEGWGWRSVYFVGTLPLILLAFARRSLKETRRFEEQKGIELPSLFAIWSTPYRRRVVQLAIIWALTYLCTQTAVFFWKEHAVAADGPLRYTDAQVGGIVVVAALVAMPLTFAVGHLFDLVGRKLGAAIVYGVMAFAVVGAYAQTNLVLLTISLTAAIFGGTAVLPVLNAFTTELFPTESRSQAFAWSNNLLGRIGYIGGPFIVGELHKLYGWGPSVIGTVPFLVLALLLIQFWLPETRGKELEESSALPDREAKGPVAFE